MSAVPPFFPPLAPPPLPGVLAPLGALTPGMGLVQPLYFRPARAIGGFIAQCTVMEDHRDSLVITQHPVERGAAITDHAFKSPPVVIVEAGWAADPPLLMALYKQIVQMQDSAEPFTVFTGKRVYDDMLVSQMRTITDNRNANTMIISFILQHIILVSTQQYKMPDPAKSDKGEATAQSQAEPQNTAVTRERGVVNLGSGRQYTVPLPQVKPPLPPPSGTPPEPPIPLAARRRQARRPRTRRAA